MRARRVAVSKLARIGESIPPSADIAGRRFGDIANAIAVSEVRPLEYLAEAFRVGAAVKDVPSLGLGMNIGTVRFLQKEERSGSWPAMYEHELVGRYGLWTWVCFSVMAPTPHRASRCARWVSTPHVDGAVV